jgi:anti-sigma B factor antagonist
VRSEHIDVTTEGAGATATLRGEFDMAATFTVEPALERLLETPELERVTIDLGALRFIDSTGVGVLLRVHDEARRREITLVIAPGPPEVQRVFEVAGLADVLPFGG